MKPHSQARNQEDEERLPLPFLKIEKSVPIFERGPDYVHLWFKFSTQTIVLKVSRRKHSKMFLCGASFLQNASC